MEIPKTDITSIYCINNKHVVAKDIHAAIKLYNMKYPYETVTKVDLIDILHLSKMKARIKQSGEVFNVGGVYLRNGSMYEMNDVEIIHEFNPSGLLIDWEQRKWELVKAAMQGLLSTELFCGHEDEEIARMAISQADAVLAEYRKGVNQ